MRGASHRPSDQRARREQKLTSSAILKKFGKDTRLSEKKAEAARAKKKSNGPKEERAESARLVDRRGDGGGKMWF